MVTSCSSVICSPLSSAAIIELMRSARGSARRSAIAWRKYASSSAEESTTRWRISGEIVGSKDMTPSSDQRLKSVRRSGSTPSISAMTIVGSGPANDAMRSNDSQSATASRS